MPERARVGDEERQESGHDHGGRRERGTAHGVAAELQQQHHGEERHGHDRELLRQDRGAEGDPGPARPASQHEREREHEQQQRRRVGRPEPGRTHDDRVRGEQHAERELLPPRSGKEQRRR